MAARTPKQHNAVDFDLDVLSGDTDLFRWFLLCYLFGKPIRSESAIKTWQLMLERALDTPWTITQASSKRLVRVLHEGGYTRYQHVTERGLRQCMEQLIHDYEGSLWLMLERSYDEDEFARRLKRLHGVGPKVAEIFMRETEEVFARRVE